MVNKQQLKLTSTFGIFTNMTSQAIFKNILDQLLS